MAFIVSVGRALPKYEYLQENVKQFIKENFRSGFKDIDRLLPVFDNGGILERQFVKPIEWYKTEHTFEEKNNTYIEVATELGVKAIDNCLNNSNILNQPIEISEIDAIFFVSSTGVSTPSIDAKIMNRLPFKETTKRIPIWGLGCAGGASGISRAFEYCRAYPESYVLIVTVELCSLTFQLSDTSKSNLIGTSLFSDGVACTCIAGKDAQLHNKLRFSTLPLVKSTGSSFMKDSEDIMGWNIKNEGFHVVFSRDIPSLITKWLRPQVIKMLKEQGLELNDIGYFLAHPGGKKILEAYKNGLDFKDKHLQISEEVLRNHGNMSSVTVMYVIQEYLEREVGLAGELGIIAALGPGFSSEMILIEWRAVT
ncbi:type III polyketide synthase [Metabacillus malikii]|uniref:Alkylresorcinol/alkylpyrone synthase n=1 Tax=Metabacillus malikii TaxID=1504265 RepID=A0ABT9Z985_9BACI|nr:3-oxoacyl-[acyl-carrier-protein] synthase III C-terminal domain-containing protein [Metabacillus malikii]MDQ0228820.1 alkylresorcinol/alkylpyrone synthase [Metabacillus malikii]